jgi:hypothetical protein
MALISGLRNVTALASATSANGTAREGATLALGTVHPGTLSVACDITIVTGSVVNTTKCQVSMDETTWYDLKSSSNVAAVTTTATATLAMQADNVSGWKFFRAVMTLSGASTAAGDLTAATYRYLKYGAL